MLYFRCNRDLVLLKFAHTVSRKVREMYDTKGYNNGQLIFKI